MRRKPLKFESLERRITLAADPFLVKDIRTGNETAGSFPDNFIQVGEQVFFTASTPQTGIELWKTDATRGGTTLVKDINPFGDRSSLPQQLTNVNGTLFFSANDGASGTELWKSDGTEEGTVRVKNIAFRRYASSSPRHLTNVNGTLYFTADPTGFGVSLWKSDGTEAGTVEIPRNGGQYVYNPESLVNFNGTLYFLYGGFGSGSMWRIDNTGNRSERFGPNSVGANSMVAVDGQLYFNAFESGKGFELWRTDGTVAGTAMLADIAPGSADSFPNQFTPVGSQLYFTATRPGEHRQLWKTDGTTAGTVLLRAVSADYDGANPRALTNVNGQLYYSGSSPRGRDLWTSDGTTAGTRLVFDFNDVIGIGPSDLVNANGQLFFSMFDRTNGQELWTSNGTSAGTQIFKEFKPGSAGGLGSLSFVNGLMYLSADDGRGEELWKSDGTTTGTVLVSDLAKSNRSSLSRYRKAALNLNGTLYFLNSDFSQYSSRGELWKSDGTTPGTQRVKLLPAGTGLASNSAQTFTNVNGTLYFTARSRSGYQLWKSDTTEAGTVPIFQLNGRPRELINVSGKLYFDNSEDGTGYELWRSDGTTAGTVMVKDILPGVFSSFPKASSISMAFYTSRPKPIRGTNCGEAMVQRLAR